MNENPNDESFGFFHCGDEHRLHIGSASSGFGGSAAPAEREALDGNQQRQNKQFRSYMLIVRL
ncbi:hypothetical protein COE35_05100 [Priestia megaterium]|nr:hypothetical protein COE35_05100 [Priestia megaterium]